MSKGGYSSAFPAEFEHARPAGLKLTPGTWHKTAAFCDWRSVSVVSCCCSALELPADFKRVRRCISSCKGPAEYPGIQRHPARDSDSDSGSDSGSDDSEDPDVGFYLHPISSVNLPFVSLQSNGLLVMTDVLQLSSTEQCRTVLDQRSLTDDSLQHVIALKAFVDEIRVESPLTHLASGSSFLDFRNLRALTVHDARWLRSVVLCDAKLHNLEHVSLSFQNSWDEGDSDEDLVAYLQKYHQDDFGAIGAFSFNEAWSHALVDSLPALESLRVESKQMRTREQRAKSGSPLTSLLVAAARRCLRSLHVDVTQNEPEMESALQKLLCANLGTLRELTLPDTDSFRFHQVLTCQPRQLIKLQLESFVEELEDLQFLRACSLLKELTLSFERTAFSKASGGMPDLRLALRKVSLSNAGDTVSLLQKLCAATELCSLQLYRCCDPNGQLCQFLPSCERLENLGFWSNIPAVLTAPPRLQDLALCAGEVSSSLEFTQALAEVLAGRPVRRLHFHSMHSLTFKDCWQLVLRTPTLEEAIFAHFYDDGAECSARAISPETLVADCIEHPCLKVLELVSALHLPGDYPFPLGSVPIPSEDTYDAAGMQYWTALISLPQVQVHHRAALLLNQDGSIARDYVRIDLSCDEHRSVTLIVRDD